MPVRGKGGTRSSPEEAVLIATLEDGGRPHSVCARPGSRVEGVGQRVLLTMTPAFAAP